MNQDKVIAKLHEVKAKGDAGQTQHLGVLTLNKPQALNALDLDMVQALQAHLDEWRNDPSVAAVLIDSAGDKAFCAGGDIVSMYKAMNNNKSIGTNALPDFMAQFFAQEYALDYTIHAYPKPIICWGNGIIMGGGLGVFAGASHKIVTQNAKVAMPEITIGLFPDVGASYFLNKMPNGVGKFLGLTATTIYAKDCLNIDFADHFLLHEDKDRLFASLSTAKSLNRTSISAICQRLSEERSVQTQYESLPSALADVANELAPLETLHDIHDALAFINRLANDSPHSKVLKKASQAISHGSPITAHLIMRQLQNSRDLSLADCFRMELSMAYQCSVVGEFQEGVRALLIDKDRNPKWLFKTHSDVPESLINQHFTRFDEDDAAHPLSSLEKRYGEYHV